LLPAACVDVSGRVVAEEGWRLAPSGSGRPFVPWEKRPSFASERVELAANVLPELCAA
jgi:hypothetical protein